MDRMVEAGPFELARSVVGSRRFLMTTKHFFKELWGDVLIELEYEKDLDW